MVNIYVYSSVRNFVIAGTDENWYMKNNNQFTVLAIKSTKVINFILCQFPLIANKIRQIHV